MFSQVEIPISTNKEFYNGKFYFVHEVQAGHTVYSIAKAYQVEVNDIYTVNPFSRDGIQIGQLLRIPIVQDISELEVLGEPPIEEKPIKYQYLLLLQYFIQENTTIQELAAKFDTDKDLITAYNQEYQNKDKVNKRSIIQIPITNSEIISKQLSITPKVQGILLEQYIVVKRETLFSISRKFGCSVSELQKFNPNISESLRSNEAIWVPSSQKATITSHQIVSKNKCEIIKNESIYNIALLIPLYLKEFNNIRFSNNASQNWGLQIEPFEYIQFYEGFLLALEKIKFNKAQINLNVYDISDNVSQITSLIQKGLLDVDLIIGPFFKPTLHTLLPYAQSKGIPVIDMTISNDLSVSYTHTELLTVYPGVLVQLENLLKYLQSLNSDKKIIVLYQNNQSENALVENLKLIHNQFKHITIQYLDYNVQGMSGLKNALVQNKENIIVNFSTNEVFLNNFFRNLFNECNGYPITLFGLPAWIRFESIDLRYLNHFNTHFYSSQFIDYNAENVSEFVTVFQQKFYTDPNRLAFLGYDVALYFLTSITTFGEDFNQCLHNIEVDLLSTGFSFEKHSNYNHYQNQFVFVYDMVDYVLLNSKRKK
jgi:LysM repeat protein